MMAFYPYVFVLLAGNQIATDRGEGAWRFVLGNSWVARFSPSWTDRYGSTWAFAIGPKVWWYTPQSKESE